MEGKDGESGLKYKDFGGGGEANANLIQWKTKEGKKKMAKDYLHVQRGIGLLGIPSICMSKNLPRC